MIQRPTSPIVVTASEDTASHSITSYVESLFDAAGEQQRILMRYLVGAALATRFPEDADTIRFGTGDGSAASLGQRADVSFNDAVFYVAHDVDDPDVADIALNANAGRIVYLLVPDEEERPFRQLLESYQQGLSRQVNVTGAAQYISLLLYRMATFDHNAALRLLTQVLRKSNELIALHEPGPALEFVFPDFAAYPRSTHH